MIAKINMGFIFLFTNPIVSISILANFIYNSPKNLNVSPLPLMVYVQSAYVLLIDIFLINP